MAHASKNRFGPAARGKRAGTGAMTPTPKEKIQENMVLSNRDKSRHSDTRGLDSKGVQTEQLQDHAANRLAEKEKGEKKA